MILHARGNDTEEGTAYVVLSPSADIDIPVIMLGNAMSEYQVYIDSGTGNHRNLSCLADIKKKALLGLHAFAGNGLVSSFFRKGKPICWNAIKKNSNFLKTHYQPTKQPLYFMEPSSCLTTSRL